VRRAVEEKTERVKISNGTILVLILGAVLVGGWFFYRGVIPPLWLRHFASDIALRGTPDPNAPPPRDTRQATPRDQADHPYICFRDAVPFAWDRLVVLPPHGDLGTFPALHGVTWPDDAARESHAAHMSEDARYQLLILVKDGAVVAAEPFFTFQADLSALGRGEGFTPETAVFTAAVHGDHYVLTPVAPPFPAVCAASR